MLESNKKKASFISGPDSLVVLNHGDGDEENFLLEINYI